MSDPLGRLAPVVRVAPAKLNLTLAVLGRRPDGYHDLHSVMAPLALADLVSLAPAASGPDRLHVTGSDLSAGPDNLVLRAVGTLRARLGRLGETLPPLAIRLEKRIPLAAGLGGGSSDAAAAIDGALEAWGLDLDSGARAGVAAAVGSDVPFFFAGGPALISGRGETVDRLPPPTGPTARCPVGRAGDPDPHRGGLRRLHRRLGLDAPHLTAPRRRVRQGAHLEGASRPGRDPRLRERPRPGDRVDRARARPIPAPPRPGPRPAGGPVWLRPDLLGPLSFAGGRRGGGRGHRPSGRRRQPAVARRRTTSRDRHDIRRASGPAEHGGRPRMTRQAIVSEGAPNPSGPTARRSRSTASSSVPVRSASIRRRASSSRGSRRRPSACCAT